ncbi:MAG: hypothetical protein FJ211_01380 [Ignavibacteria bacterium]|nr:hypothetical protein [Ignavibacteria bacterium]
MNTERPAFFSVPAVYLTAAVVFILLLLLGPAINDNPYAQSYESRVELYRSKLDSLNKIRSIRERIFMRQMANLSVAEYIDSKLRPTDTLLLPPQAYAKRYMETAVTWTDPRILTWLIGFRNVVAWTDTARRKHANAFIALEPSSIWITRPGGQTNIDSLIHEYEWSR